ncbi:anti-sigma factor antagonist [Christensenellaceae bacterium OttesenSCG-928-M15]|nr:anti-sigma factor antagonist [Christensenellaceae bacterium OttesenSCG-928-M15]
MELNAKRKGQRITVQLTGELDHHSVESAREQLDKMIADPSVTELELDMERVQFMDSSGLGMVLGRYRTLNARGGRLLLSSVPLPIDRIFKMSGLYSLVGRA